MEDGAYLVHFLEKSLQRFDSDQSLDLIGPNGKGLFLEAQIFCSVCFLEKLLFAFHILRFGLNFIGFWRVSNLFVLCMQTGSDLEKAVDE